MDDVKKIAECLERYRNVPNLEIEFRLGLMRPSNKRGGWLFDARVNKDVWFNIKKGLDSNKNWARIDTFHHVDYYAPSDGIRCTRNLATGEVHTIVKKRLENVDLRSDTGPFDIRLSVSTEEDRGVLPGAETDIPAAYSYIREKKRTSYRYKFWSYDLTIVSFVRGDSNVYEDITYELEIELVDLSEFLHRPMSYWAEAGLMKIKDCIALSGECNA